MNGAAARFLRLGASLAGLVLLGWVLTGQAAKPAKQRVPLPTDWSHSHAIFSQPQSPEDYARLADEPRYWQQLYRREAAMHGVPLAASTFKARMRRDWAVNLGSGGGIGAGNYPAKYGFDATKASCNDFVVYGTGLLSSASQASVVAFNNLYSGCTGSPSINWAYDTGGRVTTSPLSSLDGTQVAFVQDNGFFPATMVLVKWKASTTESITSPRHLTSVGPSVYATCATPPCMTTFAFRDGGGFQTGDTISSIFYDYTNDIAWVGDSGGWLHKFTPFFKGAPAEVRTSPWPLLVTGVAAGLSSPVFDRISGNVFVGDLGGFLYSVNSSTATITASGQLDFGTGLVDAPIIDVAKGFLYVFASSDGSSACTAGVACAAVYQLSTTFGSGNTGTETRIGNSVAVSTLPNPNTMYIGSFDTAYYNSANRTGTLYVCGNTGANPTLYLVPIVAGAVPASGTAITTLTPANKNPQCSSVTDILNPTGGTGGVPAERIFVSVQGNGLSGACGGGGCIFNFISAEWQPSTTYVAGQQILDGNGRIETVTVGGTSGTSVPGWGSSAGGVQTDNTVTWINEGALSASTLPGWTASHNYSSSSDRIIDTNGYVEVSTTPGISGTTQPSPWPTTPGATTPDGSVTWTNAGAVATFALSSAGGTSGIIEDNIVSQGTQPGASQVYFTTLGNQTCATSGTSGGCAVQASQPALQ